MSMSNYSKSLFVVLIALVSVGSVLAGAREMIIPSGGPYEIGGKQVYCNMPIGPDELIVSLVSDESAEIDGVVVTCEPCFGPGCD